MKIAFIFESFVRAGSQRHALEILKGIQLYRPNVLCELFLIAPLNPGWGSFLPELEAAGINVHIIPYVFDRLEGSGLRARSHNWLSRRWREKKLNSRLYQQLAEYDSIVCFQPFVAELLIPHLDPDQRMCFHLSEHMSQRSKFPYWYGLLENKRLNVIYQHPSQIVQLPRSVSLANSITWPLRLCPDHLQVPFAVSTDSAGRLRVVHYSRISPMRLIDQVIDAFALLHQQIPASLRIAGRIEDTNYHQRLLVQIERLGLNDAVQFVDPVPSPADDPARSEVDLVWMISLSGHIGYAAIEAMACGLPTLLLEVDSQAHTCPVDPAFNSLIFATPEQLVEHSITVHQDPMDFVREQSQLVRERFIAIEESIIQLTDFYLGRA